MKRITPLAEALADGTLVVDVDGVNIDLGGIRSARLDGVKGTELGTRDLNDVTTPGGYFQVSSANATTARNYPFAVYGNLRVLSEHSTDANLIQEYIPAPHYETGFARRSLRSTGWSAWAYYQSVAETETQVTSLVSETVDAAPAAGMKRVPLVLSLGHGSDYAGPAACTFRVPLLFMPDIPRYRVHIRNDNPRTGALRAGGGAFTGIWQGVHATDGAFTGTPTQVVGAFETPEDGSEWVSDWINQPLGGGTEYLLSFGYTSSTTPGPSFNAGGCWRNDESANYGPTVSASTMTRQNLVPFDIWIEAEVATSVPVLAGVGDSLTCGIGADFTVADSWVSQWARAHDALPVHFAIGGTQMSSWHRNMYVLNRWAGLARPDAVVVGIGSNDVFTGATLAQMQDRATALAPLVVEKISARMHGATVMPRSNRTGAEEDVRRAYNTWLRAQPLGLRGVFDFAASISTDDENILPAYAATDLTHLNAAGYAQNALTISGVTAPALASTASVTAVETRVDTALYDSGLRDITTLAAGVTAGAVRFRTRRGRARVTLEGVQTSTASAQLFPNTGGALVPYRPVAPDAGFGVVTSVNSGDTYRIQVNSNGGLTLYGAPASTVLNGWVEWDMDRTPPAMPIGDAA
ncbi:GDSL-type esterase/lipase family protein [Brachybacterium sp. DNPG3]